MKSFAGILLALLLGAAFAFIRPAQPYQVENPSAAFVVDNGLDNEAIPSDSSIHPARKCKLLSS